MSTVQARHGTPRKTLGSKEQKTAAVYLGQLSAATFARLPPRMQAACQELVRLGEISIENIPSPVAGR